MKNHALYLLAVIAVLTLARTGFAQVTTTVLTGGDAGQGLTLDPAKVVSALNIYGSNYRLQGVDFTSRAVGTKFSGPLAFAAGETSANDVAMRNLLNDLGFSGVSTPMTVNFSGLTPHASYRLDLLQSVLAYSPREQAIVVNDELVTLVDLGLGTAYNTSFITTANGDGLIDLMVAASLGYGGTGNQDGAVLNAVVLTAVPEPATYAAFLGLAAMGWTLWRRRRSGGMSSPTRSVDSSGGPAKKD